MIKVRYLALLAAMCAAGSAASDANAAALTFAGSDYNIGGPPDLFPGGAPPYVVVPWRSEGVVKPWDIDGNNVYGSDGYALFGTQFAYPTYSCCGSSQPFASATFPNMIDLPSYVTSSQALVSNKVGGWSYALVDDPTLVNGYRDYNWGMTQSPPRPGPDQSPYQKIGILDGNDIFGNNPKTSAIGAGRWAFTVGADVPETLRIGVMTDGLDDVAWAATEVLLYQVTGGTTIIGSATTGAVTRNRFVDIHTFDIVGAQAGDTFAIFAKAPANPFMGNGAISGVTFDAIPEPASLVMMLGLAAAGSALRIGRRK
jgi:hypothetical protein